MQGHRYGLLGPNGSGKSTLLRRMARGSIPGFPFHLRVEYVQQEQPNIPSILVRDFIFSSDAATGKPRQESLEDEEGELAGLLASGNLSDKEIEDITERMCLIADELEKIEANGSLASATMVSYFSKASILILI